MHVLAYPANYSGDMKALPVRHAGGAFVLAVEFGDYLNEELLAIYIRATRMGCQWVIFDEQPIVRDEPRWIEL